jgi:phosphatidate cytidylyltransferase
MIPLALFLMAYKITFIILLLLAFMIAVYEWAGLVRATSGRKIFVSLVGLIYIPACFISFAELRFMPEGLFIVVTLLIAVWASDIGAYTVGKLVGGPKWIPSISPNKTWAGLGGAMLGSACIMPWWTFYYSSELLSDASLIEMIIVQSAYFIFGGVLGFVCQIGDVFISVFKRWAGVKDTGRLIPGHGGLLDRIDSLMLGSAFFFLALKLMPF